MNFGKLPWKELVQPTIDLARNGIPPSPQLKRMMEKHKKRVKKDPGLTQMLYGKELIKNEPLAKTLEIIRDDPDDFYYGNLAKKIVKDVAAKDGIITLDDLASY